jgi:hypothetical protein
MGMVSDPKLFYDEVNQLEILTHSYLCVFLFCQS